MEKNTATWIWMVYVKDNSVREENLAIGCWELTRHVPYHSNSTAQSASYEIPLHEREKIAATFFLFFSVHLPYHALFSIIDLVSNLFTLVDTPLTSISIIVWFQPY